MVIGTRIKEARIKRNLSQEELGNLIGVTKVSVCGYENGTRTPTMKIFLSIINVLDLDPNYLLGRDLNVVSDQDENYTIKLSTLDLEILKAIKKESILYNKLLSEPSRTINLISRKIDK